MLQEVKAEVEEKARKKEGVKDISVENQTSSQNDTTIGIDIITNGSSKPR